MMSEVMVCQAFTAVFVMLGWASHVLKITGTAAGNPLFSSNNVDGPQLMLACAALKVSAQALLVHVVPSTSCIRPRSRCRRRVMKTKHAMLEVCVRKWVHNLAMTI